MWQISLFVWIIGITAVNTRRFNRPSGMVNLFTLYASSMRQEVSPQELRQLITCTTRPISTLNVYYNNDKTQNGLYAYTGKC